MCVVTGLQAKPDPFADSSSRLVKRCEDVVSYCATLEKQGVCDEEKFSGSFGKLMREESCKKTCGNC